MIMKSPSLAGLLALALCVPVAAETIYSGLLNTEIPTDFTGVTITIDGGTINPFFGGVAVANNDALQPYRDGTDNLDTLLNLSAGTVIDANLLYLSDGSGGSQDHLGSTFTAGQEGYIGFKLNDTDYGWIRVVFTNNTGGAMILDYAYDDNGGAIAVGNVTQSGSVITLNSNSMSFTLGSTLSGDNSVIKTGANTTTLVADNTYTGTTTINQGTLLINGDQSDATGGVIVNNGGTLGGTGIIGATVTLNVGGTLSAGDGGIGTLSTAGNTWYGDSTYVFEFSTDGSTGIAGGAWDLLSIDGTLNLTNASISNPITIGLITMEDADSSGLLAIWDPNVDSVWSSFITTDGIIDFAANLFAFDLSGFQNTLNGTFSVVQNGDNLDLVYTAIPEPRAALLGGIGVLLLLRRRR